MKRSKMSLEKELREQMFDVVREPLLAQYGEVLRVGVSEFSVPVVDAEGNETFMNFSCKVPRGERGGAPYDGYAAAQEYAELCAQKAEEKRAKAAIREQNRAAKRVPKKKSF